jgi:uncharacterized membrane protein
MAPLLSMLGNVVLASSLSQITSRENPELLEQGLLMISLVSNASISIVTLTFSLTVLSIQIAAQSYSPRLLDDFMVSQHVYRAVPRIPNTESRLILPSL